MKQRLNCILLIDDSEADNYLDTMVAEETEVADEVVAIERPVDALDYLKTKKDGEYPKPALIFLDINMPGMTGWEFPEVYETLDTDQQGKVIVVMLTTTLNPNDEARAKDSPSIKGFERKPLTHEGLQTIVKEYFPDRI